MLILSLARPSRLVRAALLALVTACLLLPPQISATGAAGIAFPASGAEVRGVGRATAQPGPAGPPPCGVDANAPPALLTGPCPHQGQTASYPVGWNLIADPTGTRFPAVGYLYTLQTADSDYEILPASASVSAGRGFWANFPVPTTLTLTAGSDVPATVVAPAGRYIMIGNPGGSLPAAVTGADLIYT